MLYPLISNHVLKFFLYRFPFALKLLSLKAKQNKNKNKISGWMQLHGSLWAVWALEPSECKQLLTKLYVRRWEPLSAHPFIWVKLEGCPRGVFCTCIWLPPGVLFHHSYWSFCTNLKECPYNARHFQSSMAFPCAEAGTMMKCLPYLPQVLLAH